MRFRRPATRCSVQALAVLAAASSVAANLTTTPDRDTPLHQAGRERAVERQAVAQPDLLGFEHVANLDLSAWDALGVRSDAEPFDDDDGIGTFIDFTSFVVAGEGLRDFALMGSDFAGTFVIDITDPSDPHVRGHIPCKYEQSEVVVVNGVPGRQVIAIGNQDGESCVPRRHRVKLLNSANEPLLPGRQGTELVSVWDITDPDDPQFLSAFSDTNTDGTHTLESHPTEPVIIPVGGSQSRLQFVDLSEPEVPEILTYVDTWSTTHAVHFSPDGTKLTTAGGLVEAVNVFDTTDLANPIIEAVAVVPGQTYSHEVHPFTQVDAVTGLIRQYHIATEENLAGPFAGTCSSTGFFVFEQAQAAMLPLSFTTSGFAPGTSSHRDGVDQYCTGHYGSVSRDGGAYVVPWYIAGLYVFDLSNPLAPAEVAHAIMPDSNAWTAKAYKDNHVFVGDLTRGFDVFRYTGDLDLSVVAPVSPNPCHRIADRACADRGPSL